VFLEEFSGVAMALSLPFGSLSSTMLKHSPLDRTKQVPRQIATQPW